MKNLMLVIVWAIILSFGVAFGQDLSYSVGVKAWFNSWEFEYGGDSETTDPVLMIGPSVSINFEWMILNLYKSQFKNFVNSQKTTYLHDNFVKL